MPQNVDSWTFTPKRGHVNLVLELYCTLDMKYDLVTSLKLAAIAVHNFFWHSHPFDFANCF